VNLIIFVFELKSHSVKLVSEHVYSALVSCHHLEVDLALISLVYSLLDIDPQSINLDIRFFQFFASQVVDVIESFYLHRHHCYSFFILVKGFSLESHLLDFFDSNNQNFSFSFQNQILFLQRF
jgi:hypothetical protein